MNEKGSIRFQPSVGLGLVVLRSPVNYQPVDDNALLEENYTYDFNRYSTLGIVIAPKIEFILSNSFGMAIAPGLHIKKDESIYGIGVNFMFGKLK